MAGNHTLGTIRGTIEIDYDGAGIVKAIRDTDRLKSAGERIDKMSSRVLSAFGKFARGAVAVSSGVGLAYNAVTLVAGALAVVGPLAAAAFAAAPGIIAGFVAANLVLKVALSGVSDAMAAAGESSEKFEKAIKKLSPEAQKFARAYRAAQPALKSFKDSVQDAFFKGLGPELTKTIGKLGSLKGGAVGIAAAFNTIVQRVMAWARSNAAIANFQKILAGVRSFLVNIDGAIVPLLDSFISLAAQMGEFGEGMGGGLAAILLKVADFVKNVDLAALFERALPILKSLGTLLSNVGIIVSELFGMFNVDGASAAGILGELAGQLAAFLQSADGQGALAALGLALQTIAGASGQIFLALLKALAPTIVALAPGITTLANQIAAVLVPAIGFLNPLLVALAGFLSDNMGWLGPLAGVVVALAGAYKIYAAAVKAVIAVKALELASKAKDVAGWIASTAATVAHTAATVANAAVRAGAFLASFVASTAAMIASTAAMVAQKVAMVAGAIATKAIAAAQWLLNAAMAANPIGLVVIAIVALVAALVYAYRNSETFRNIVNAAWAMIKTAVMATVRWITGTAVPWLVGAWKAISRHVQALVADVRSKWNTLTSAVRTAVNAIRTVVMAVWRFIVSAVKTYINTYVAVIRAGVNLAKSVFQAVMNAIRAVASAVWNAIVSLVRSRINAVKSAINGVKAVIAIVRNAFNGAKNAASSTLNSLVSIVRGLRSRISGALGNLGSLLYGKGKSLVQGFINGIKSMLGAVSGAGRSIVNKITSFLPGSPAKEGPLSGKGYALLRARRMMTDIAAGINDRSDLPARAMAGAVTPMARAVVPSVSSTGSGAATTTPTSVGGRTFGPYNLEVDGRVLTSFVVDTITGNPVIVSRASDEGKRKKSWAGSGRS